MGDRFQSLDSNVHLNSKKFASHRYWNFDAKIVDILSFFYSKDFEQFLEKVTGIGGIHADFEYNWGGGYHLLPKGEPQCP